jgi:hypothetical protein
VQVEQLVALAQGSAVPASAPAVEHAELIHAQLPVAQVEPVGPLVAPGRHRPEAAHQPHCERCVQVEQLVALEHGSPASVAVMHDERVHAQFDVQVEPVGPVVVPDWHRPVAPHQPHCDSAVQVSHMVCAAHGSAGTSMAGGVSVTTTPVSCGPASGVPASGAVQVAAFMVHPTAQAPALGPVALPATQVFVSPHHPHGPSDAQVVQLVTAPQFTICMGMSGAVTTSCATMSGVAEASPITVSCAVEHDATKAPSSMAEAS